MLTNYFKIAWRNIIKSRFYSVVNIIGLSTGIAFAMLIAAYVWSEWQVNKDLKNWDRQYIIQSNWKNPNEGFFLSTLGPLAKALRENYPNLVANYYRFDGITSNVSKGDKAFREDIQIGDSTLLNMYGFTLLHGDAKTALRDPFSVVVTEDRAIKYFGTTDVLGQTITIENFSGSKHDFLIAGVLDKLSNNSVTDLVDGYPGHFYVSADNLPFFGRNMDWQNPHIANYIELQKGVSPKELTQPMAHLIKQNAPPQMAADFKPELVLLHDFYLNANNSLLKKMLYSLSAIALFILLMAVINFINMSVSRSAARMKEIGVRKVLGGMKKQLMMQFLIESIIIVFVATLLAFIIYLLTQNIFSGILIHPIPSLTGFPFYFVAFPFLFSLLLGFIAGIYPAFVLSSLKSVDSLKGRLSSVKDHILLRKSLLAFQFITATIAFVSAIVISQQINLFLKSNLGYDKDYIFSAQLPRDWSQQGVEKMKTIRNEFAAIPQVSGISLSFEIPDGNNSNNVPLFKMGSDSTTAIATSLLENDENFLSLYHIPLIAGNSFQGHRLDSLKVILNETAVTALGFADAKESIGQQVKIPGNPSAFTIIGVTNNFHFGSMQTAVQPIIMFNLDFDFVYRFFSFKLKPGNIAAGVDAIQKKWNALLPGAPFEYKFMDDSLANMYKSEIQLKKAAYTATILALIIVLLGVVGLISVSIQKRTKEIGIRKVLGSSVAAIISLFIKEFVWIIFIGGLIACPLAYLIMHNWLQNYAYRIDMTAMPFVISIVCLGLITALLICLQTIKSAIANPAKSLRAE